jgi:hypothetical protein
MRIEGNTYTAEVNKDSQLLTRAVAITALHNASLKGDAYSWKAVNANIDATDTALLIRNDSVTRYLVVEKLYVWSDVASAIHVHMTNKATFTATGTAVVGVNLNTASNNVAPATAIADETANTQGNIILTLETNETTTDIFGITYDFNGSVILGQNGCIAVDLVAEPAAFECTIIGYFLDR